MRIALFAVISRSFISRGSNIQLRVSGLRLSHFRAFAQLPRPASERLLLFSLPSRWLIEAIAIVVGHRSLLDGSIHEVCRLGIRATDWVNCESSRQWATRPTMSEKKRQKKAGQDKGKKNQARRRANPRPNTKRPADRAIAASNLNDDDARPARRSVRRATATPRRRTATKGRMAASAPAAARRKAAREGKGK
jgi:hypothetical protein